MARDANTGSVPSVAKLPPRHSLECPTWNNTLGHSEDCQAGIQSQSRWITCSYVLGATAKQSSPSPSMAGSTTRASTMSTGSASITGGLCVLVSSNLKGSVLRSEAAMASFKSPSSRRWVANRDRREILATRRARKASRREGTQCIEFTYLHPRALRGYSRDSAARD